MAKIDKTRKNDGWTRETLYAAAVYMRSFSVAYGWEFVSMTEIASSLGRSRTQISEILADPERVKDKARRRRQGGICAECGYPTSVAKDGKPSPKCIYCVQGIERPRSTIPRLCVPVRLAEIPLDVRLDAVREASKFWKEDPDGILSLLNAAINPSSRMYLVSENARPLVDGWRNAEPPPERRAAA